MHHSELRPQTRDGCARGQPSRTALALATALQLTSPSSAAQGLKSSQIRGVECEWTLLRRIWTQEACTRMHLQVSPAPRTPEWCCVVAQPAPRPSTRSAEPRARETLAPSDGVERWRRLSHPCPRQQVQSSQVKSSEPAGGRPECAFKRSGTAASARTHHPPAEPRRSTAVVSGREW